MALKINSFDPHAHPRMPQPPAPGADQQPAPEAVLSADQFGQLMSGLERVFTELKDQLADIRDQLSALQNPVAAEVPADANQAPPAQDAAAQGAPNDASQAPPAPPQN